MWNIIDTEIIDNLQPSDIIATNPSDSETYYEIRTIKNGFIRAIHAEGIPRFKILPNSALIADKWWIMK
jgi:hypothetical protein